MAGIPWREAKGLSTRHTYSAAQRPKWSQDSPGQLLKHHSGRGFFDMFKPRGQLGVLAGLRQGGILSRPLYGLHVDHLTTILKIQDSTVMNDLLNAELVCSYSRMAAFSQQQPQ